MKKYFIIAHIQDHKIVNKTPLAKLLWELKDGKYEIEFKSVGKRSNQANKYYWMMLTEYIQPALYDAGWSDIKTKDDAHFFVSNLFLKVKMVNEQTGDVMERIRSTTELTKMEFSTYLEEIWRWASEYLGIAIPSPNQQFVLYEEK